MRKIPLLITLLSLGIKSQMQYLDANFNTSGYISSDYRNKSSDELLKIRFSNDNNFIYGLGNISISDYKSYESGLGIIKYNLNTGLNQSFGNFGKQHYYIDTYENAPPNYDSYHFPNGSLLILSSSGLYKIDNNGNLDQSFGFNGKQQLEIKCSGRKILMLSNGSFFVFGNKQVNYDNDLYIQKFNADGFPDDSFGNMSVKIYNLGTMEDIVDAQLLNDGKILITANSKKQVNSNTYYNYRYSILRKMNLNGDFDTTFEYNYIPYLSGGEFLKSILSDDQNFLYVAMYDRILKINLQNSTIVQSYGNLSTSPFGWSNFKIADFTIKNNKIYIAGGYSQNPYSSSDVYNNWIQCYNMDGTLDTSFANQGSFIYFQSTEPTSSAKSILVADDGSVYCATSRNSDYLLYKILPALTLNTSDFNYKNTQILYIYPNPVIDTVTANLVLEKPQKLDIQVFDLSGKLIKQFSNLSTVKGKNEIKVNLSDLPVGNYMLNFITNEYSQSVKIIKK